MNLKRLALVPLIAAAATAGAHAETYTDSARVRNVEPQYERVQVPREECTSQWVSDARRGGGGGRDYAGAVLGGVAGGVIGNQVGKGHGREAATAVGAVIGALAGDNLANRDRWERHEPAPREVTTCRTVQDVQTRLVGYRVDYEYRGQAFQTMLRDDPGPYLPVRVSVEPVAR